MASESEPRDFEELKFIDHYENKIVSPEKEMISPTKEVINPIIEIGQNLDTEAAKEKEVIERFSHDISDSHKLKIENNGEEVELDSGLDSSDDNSENEKFVDRQENIVSVDMPEVLSPSSNVFDPSRSTSNIVDELFNFINDENMGGDIEEQNGNVEELKIAENSNENDSSEGVEWSLDAVNNNNAQVVQSCAMELKSEPKPETEFVLTAKTEMPKIVEDNVHLIPDTVGDSNMNLYWYSTNLELDPSEIQEFKNSQIDSEETKSDRSSTGDEYYREKMEEPRVSAEDQMLQTENKNRNAESPSVISERWSPIFESASSRFLDLASEMKAQPDNSEPIQNKNTEEEVEHPWGLETEQKHLSDTENKQEELPEIEPEFHPLTELEQVSKVDQSPNETVDMKLSFQIKKNVSLKKFNSDVTSEQHEDTADSNRQIKSENVGNMDQTDDTGYMELADKDIIKEQDASVHKLDNSVENIPGDQTDATGLMELADRESIKAEIDNSLYAHLSEKDVKNEDNLKKKSEDKFVIEQFEKGEVEILHTENQEMTLMDKSEQDAESYKADITTESNNFKDTSTFEKESDLTSAVDTDMIDAPNQEMQSEHDKGLEPEMLKAEASQSLLTETTLIKHEPIEVKRKFKVYDDSDIKLVNKGGKLLETEIFEDQYLDDDCYNLTLTDSWLRKRNTTFEFKINSSSVLSGGEILSDEKAIIESLQKMFPKTIDIGLHESLSELLDDLGFSEFASFQTTRKLYQLDDLTFTLDMTDFGFQVSDIMVIVDNPAKISDAILRIDNVAKELGEFLCFEHLGL